MALGACCSSARSEGGFGGEISSDVGGRRDAAVPLFLLLPLSGVSWSSLERRFLSPYPASAQWRPLLCDDIAQCEMKSRGSGGGFFASVPLCTIMQAIQ